jgi:hypothetical protein
VVKLGPAAEQESNNFPLANAFQSARSGDWDLVLPKFSAAKIAQREARDVTVPVIDESFKNIRP